MEYEKVEVENKKLKKKNDELKEEQFALRVQIVKLEFELKLDKALKNSKKGSSSKKPQKLNDVVSTNVL